MANWYNNKMTITGPSSLLDVLFAGQLSPEGEHRYCDPGEDKEPFAPGCCFCNFGDYPDAGTRTREAEYLECDHPASYPQVARWCSLTHGSQWGIINWRKEKSDDGDIYSITVECYSIRDTAIPLMTEASYCFPDLSFHMDFGSCDEGVEGGVDAKGGEASGYWEELIPDPDPSMVAESVQEQSKTGEEKRDCGGEDSNGDGDETDIFAGLDDDF